jgi:hypothetical protein
MAKGPDTEAAAGIFDSVLSTPTAIAEHLVSIARKSSVPEEDSAIRAVFKSHPQLVAQSVPLICQMLQQSKKVTGYDAESIAFRGILRLKLPFDLTIAGSVFDYIQNQKKLSTYSDPLLLLVGVAERLMSDHDLQRLPQPIEKSLTKIRDAIADGHCQRNERKAIERIDALLGQTATLPLKPGDPIADAVIADLERLDPAERSAWIALLSHCSKASGSAPAKSWLKPLDSLLSPLADKLTTQLARWFPQLSASRADGKPARINPSNYEVLTGVTRTAAVLVERGNYDPALAAALQQLAIAAYTKVPGLGRRCPKVGDAAVMALGHCPLDVAAARLTAIHRSARDPMTAETIGAALNALAAKAAIPRDQLEELTVPTFGLSPDGKRQVPLGPVTAAIDITTGSAEITFVTDKGKPIKTIPAAVKREYDDAIKALKQDAKDLDKLLSSQRDRLDALLGTTRFWPLADFRRLYLDHPLVSRVARRLIWTFDGEPALFREDRFEDVAGKPLKTTAKSRVSPWHPLNAEPDTVLAWRRRLESLEITQPFKQAHREIYILTEAERATETYSNRFAAHIIRQAQFRALAAARGWTAPYLGGWDHGGQVPSRDLPAHNLRIEFWVEEAPIEHTDTAVLPGGGVAYLTTDQVRFCRMGNNDALPLEQIPPLVFSECLRDVDLFVSVCSVANDPTWRDAGDRTAAQREYWTAVSFGELTQSAQTRRAVLETLLPRLTKLRDRWELTDRFLVIRGEIRTYKIHLGSGNILMEPNDQYLCIVPGRSTSGGTGRTDGLFLPFEGDDRMSVILSKAFLLSDDKSITDPTITRQIARGT